MKRSIPILTIIMASVSTFGCSMCCGPYDYDYPNYGGIHERVDPSYGRVGSIFSDPNANAFGPSADSNLTPHDEAKSKSRDEVDDLDMERYRRELDEELEGIDPMKESEKPNMDTLPAPNATGRPSASRLSNPRPLRSGPEWR